MNIKLSLNFKKAAAPSVEDLQKLDAALQSTITTWMRERDRYADYSVFSATEESWVQGLQSLSIEQQTIYEIRRPLKPSEEKS